MEKILSDELMSAVTTLGELIKNDPRSAEMKEASEQYNADEELSRALDEYSALQTKLSAEFEKPDFDPSSIKSYQVEMDELYAKITSSASYVRLREASDAYEEMTGAVYSELEYAVTGKRKVECTHDCSTCHGCD